MISIVTVQAPPTRRSSVSLVVVLLLALTACGSGHLRVTGIELGRSVNADSSIANPTTTFAPRDTVHLSVSTAGVGSATIGVRWLYGERVVDEPKKKVSYRDLASTEFSLQSLSGFPPGEYRAEVFVDGQPVGTKTFRVDAGR
ncbi:MAG: hypothetical protein HOQ29_18740 [Acidobacteria bacterium]|nr:hypothetical protein [Acidobacteriota bacterium]